MATILDVGDESRDSDVQELKKKDDFTRVYISTTLGNSDVGISKYAPNGSVSSFRPSETLESHAESLIWMKYSIRVYMTIFIKFDQLYGDF